MSEFIAPAIARVEEQYGVRVLFACESGSRAWGFASPDSDYDLRFIYLAPLDWHLALEERRNTIEFFADNDLDLAGWELSKALRLFHDGNVALFEWLGSPVIYHDDARLATALREHMPDYFNGIKAHNHYRRAALGRLDDADPAAPIGIKHLFYIIRPLACCRWIVEHASMPPTGFADVLAGIELEAALADCIAELLQQKAQAAEGQLIAPPAVLVDWIRSELREGELLLLQPARTKDWSRLNRILLDYLAAGQPD